MRPRPASKSPRRTAAPSGPELPGHPPLRDLLADGGVVVGVDPGSHTGIVAVQVTGDLRWERATVLGVHSLAPSDRKGLWGPARDVEYADRIAMTLAKFLPRHVALEEPKDGSILWRGMKRQQKSTAFRLGAYYGYAAQGAVRTGALEVASYPVTTSRSEVGWMGGRSHGQVRAEGAMLARVMGADASGWSDHAWMALGVISHHLKVIGALRDVERMTRLVQRAG